MRRRSCVSLLTMSMSIPDTNSVAPKCIRSEALSLLLTAVNQGDITETLRSSDTSA